MVVTALEEAMEFIFQLVVHDNSRLENGTRLEKARKLRPEAMDLKELEKLIHKADPP